MRVQRVDESEPATRQGLNELRILGIITQGLPQLPDSGADAGVELDDRVVWPESFADLFSGYDLAGTIQQRD